MFTITGRKKSSSLACAFSVFICKVKSTSASAGLPEICLDYVHWYVMSLAALFLGFFSGIFGTNELESSHQVHDTTQRTQASQATLQRPEPSATAQDATSFKVRNCRACKCKEGQQACWQVMYGGQWFSSIFKNLPLASKLSPSQVWKDWQFFVMWIEKNVQTLYNNHSYKLALSLYAISPFNLNILIHSSNLVFSLWVTGQDRSSM